MARRLRQELKGGVAALDKGPREKVLVLLTEVAALMCGGLNTATQSGHIAGSSMEIAYWLYGEIHWSNPLPADTLLRTCGKSLSGPFIDKFFWDLLGSEDINVKWAATTLAEGMLMEEGAAKVLAAHLTANGRGSTASDCKVESVREQQRRYGSLREGVPVAA
jgi:hypothetical protein